MNEAENLFYQCCARIDEDNLENAEYFLVGCITYLIRDRDEKGIREKVEEHLKTCNYAPYLRELRFISTMRDDALEALKGSSIDLSYMEKLSTLILEHIQYAKKEDIQGTTHAGKAQRIIDNMVEISKYIRGTKKEINQPALFMVDTSWQD